MKAVESDIQEQNHPVLSKDFGKKKRFEMGYFGLNCLRIENDEAHFWLNGYVNKQNCRIWSEANPQVYVETPLHSEKLTVWCTLWYGGVLLQKRWPQRYSQW
ncbi:hypothetical protein TNCV_3092471 [Trichonephila clavipes]|uniref:Uncharacterized protein n=1 Tax=Trichonephila clavipes TaxID=2585209 RepID=A0A8X6S7Y5_TRICX|nr:hypothetical protein TNCV_3092471 [Trichonephila clavipes]